MVLNARRQLVLIESFYTLLADSLVTKKQRQRLDRLQRKKSALFIHSYKKLC